jgi:drug/metabolite transporter (DMT)-like permease
MTSKAAEGSLSPGSDSTGTGDIIYTPAESLDSTCASTSLNPPQPQPRRQSPSPLRIQTRPGDGQGTPGATQGKKSRAHFEEDLSDDEDDMSSTRPSMHRPASDAQRPLLQEEDKDIFRGRESFQDAHGSSRPAFASRRSTFRSRSPSFAVPENQTRRKYIYAAFFLILSLISFVVQTETAVYIQHTLKWKKAYCMLWLTHSSWSLLWPMQLLIIRIQKRKLSWPAFWRRHVYLVRTTAQMVQNQDLHLNPTTSARSPWRYMFKTTAFVTTFLTVAGGSWYVAVDMTSPSDLTAIYNCSAFFAYVFSIMLLNDKLRFDKMLSVGLAILGVLIVAYGDSEAPKSPSHGGGGSGGSTHTPDSETQNRSLGNLVIGVGSVMYGLYEVLYKRFACPPEGCSPGRGMIFANTFGSMVGCFTFLVLWIPIPILHFTGIEPFELPRGEAASLLFISTLSNAVFSGSFLVLMSLTSPVLSSVAALLTIFLVAIVDWLLTGAPLSAAALSGGCLIIFAFVMLSWATYREMNEEEKKREAEEGVMIDPEDESAMASPDSEDRKPLRPR